MDPLASIREKALAADEDGRRAIIDQLTGLAHELESPEDCMQRLMYEPLTLPIVRAGCDLGIFNQLAASDKPLSSAELAEKCGSAPLLMSRFLRFLAGVDIIAEAGPDSYTTTKTTKMLAQENWQSAMYHNCDMVMPCVAAMPDFFKERKYQDSENPADCAFNKAFKSDLMAFQWYPQHPELFAHFNRFMSVQRAGMPTWLDKYPFLDRAKAATQPEQPLFIDIGGGIGHQSVALRGALPAEVKGRIVVQDQPPLIAQSIQCEGVEQMVYDFFTPQPVAGANMYYMRNILHDWSDALCLQILGHVRDAMNEDSVLLIDEMALPNVGAHQRASQLDMVMMSALAARERTQQQWEELLPKAGLRIRKIYQYTTLLCDSIIECVKA